MAYFRFARQDLKTKHITRQSGLGGSSMDCETTQKINGDRTDGTGILILSTAFYDKHMEEDGPPMVW